MQVSPNLPAWMPGAGAITLAEPASRGNGAILAPLIATRTVAQPPGRRPHLLGGAGVSPMLNDGSADRLCLVKVGKMGSMGKGDYRAHPSVDRSRQLSCSRPTMRSAQQLPGQANLPPSMQYRMP